MTLLTRYDITDLNNGNVPEFPVQSPPGWDDVSLYYAKALQQMGWKDPAAQGSNVETLWQYSDTPTSYYFQAAMHWTPKWPSTLPPAPYDERWNHCTHGPASAEQYFLPWHRAYIYWYEVIVRGYVAQLGGPDEWALPYWNYSYWDDADPQEPWPRSALPWAFCQPTLPDGSANPLYFADYAKRGLQPFWPGSQEQMFLYELTPYYDEAYGYTDYDPFNGTLDVQPHGAVHGDVGTGNGQVSATGWMRSTVTASFDPIFWLHHSEVDRFWAGWTANGNPGSQNPAWPSAQDDPLRTTRWNFWRDADIANVVNVYPGDMVDPANLDAPFPHSYQYATLPQMPPPLTPGRQTVRVATPDALSPAGLRPAEVTAGAAGGGGNPEIARGEGPVELGTAPVSTSVPLSQEARPVLEALSATPEEAPRVYLDLEDVVSPEGAPGNYEVYVNYPDADLQTTGGVPNYVGLLAGFGADHHHGEGHEGHGLSASYDITELVNYLQSTGGWRPDDVVVTFVPAVTVRPGMEIVTGPLRVGSVKIRTG